MKEPSSSSDNREARARKRSSVSRPYTDNCSRKEDCSSKRSKQEKNPPRRRTKSISMTPSSRTSEREAEDKRTGTPWMDLMKEQKFSLVEHRLHHEILAYLTYMEQTPQEKRARELVMTGIRRVVHGRFYGAEVSVYGSTATGLCLPTSDIDVALTIPRIVNADVKRTLFQLSAQLRSSPMTSNVFVNYRAHVPILMFDTREEYGSFSVDMNINNASGAQGVEIIKKYLAEMPALQPLVLLLKGFLRQRQLNDAAKGGLGSYALICLCIHLLQANPSSRPREYIDKPMEAESLGFLLTDFMFYYGLTFPYATSYISPSTSPGIVLLKPQESDQLSVRCLINPENEIAKSVAKVRPLLDNFKDAYGTLLQLNIVDDNLLGQIIRVDRKFIAQRARLSGPSPPANAPQAPQTYHNNQNMQHYLPARPPSANIPRAPRPWRGTPIGPSRMQDPLPTAPKLK